MWPEYRKKVREFRIIQIFSFQKIGRNIVEKGNVPYFCNLLS